MKTQYRDVNMRHERMSRLILINKIIEEYQKAGYVLTLRQLYYQLVSRSVIANRVQEYNNLSTLLTEGRMAGLVDWDAIEDRLRKPSSPASFNGPKEILDAAINQYQLPRLKGQSTYLEVWVEKDALSGVLGRVTRKYHVPIMVNRGYSSASAMHDAYERFEEPYNKERKIRILYLGDYDPSGLDMIRDVDNRIREFFIGAKMSGRDDDPLKLTSQSEYMYLSEQINLDFEIIPIALTRKQIDKYKPPPNPAKRTDPRADKFIEDHGTTSWEVDALKPEVLNDILLTNIEEHIDIKLYNKVVSAEKADKKKLEALKTYL